MIKVGLLSDTHGYFDPKMNEYFGECDEIWHAGDFGSIDVAEALQSIAPLKGVYGNVDGQAIRDSYPKHQRFEYEGLKIWMTHIGGTLGRYCLPIREQMEQNPPDVFICGHSHILKVGRDQDKDGMLYINPGAAGKQGLHNERTCLRFKIGSGKIDNMEVIHL